MMVYLIALVQDTQLIVSTTALCRSLLAAGLLIGWALLYCCQRRLPSLFFFLF